METKKVKKEEIQWINEETQKIHFHLLAELHRMEKDVNDRFTSLKNEFDIRQSDQPIIKVSHRQMNESRVFIPRNSLLTDLLQQPHINSLRNVFAATLIILLIQVTINDIVQDGRLDLDYTLIFESFAKLHIALFVWLIMQLSTTVVIFMGFHTWINHRVYSGKSLKIYDGLWLLIYVIYMILFLVFPSREVVKHQLPVASAMIVLLEQLRQLMKTHSFIRENLEKVVFLDSSTIDRKTLCPDFSHYLYFLFAPTLIYRDQYPRNASIQWDFVLKMFGQVLACMLYVYYIVVRFCIPTYENLNQNDITLPIFISVLFNSIMPGSLFLLLGFYGFLHCWLNAFAEMLRFADRMFYKDWWTSTSFAAYYRTWNVVVHDWLYTYVYREIYMLIGGRNRVIPAMCVVLLSATFHEYVMIFALGFFYPVMFILFGVVGLAFLFFLPRNQGTIYNILIWLFLLVGVGLQSCFYFMEAYARKSCPENDTIWDKVIPRSFVCRISLPASKLLRIDL